MFRNMRRRRSLICLIIFFSVGMTGCGGRPLGVEDHSRDPERYAMNIKRMVFAAIESAQRSREPGDELWPVILELEQKDRPRGPYAEVYRELEQKLRELHQLCQENESRPPGNLRQRLDAIRQVAEKLPGEVAVTVQGQD